MSDRYIYRYSKFRLPLSVFILSTGIVVYEIQMIHFFSIVQWNHFAYMVISIALLGFGASGTLLSLFRKEMLKRADWLLPTFMISSGLLMSISMRISRMDFMLFDSYLLFVDPSQISKLLGTYFLFFLPFLMASMALGLIFVKKVAQIGTFYFSDMIGSGLGGVLAIFLLWEFGPTDLPWVIALLPLSAGALLIGKKNRLFLVGYSLLVISSCLYQYHKPFDLKPSQFKSISYALNLSDAVIEHEISSPYGLVQVVSSPMQRYAPGLSLNYKHDILPSKMIFNNGNWYATIPSPYKSDSINILDYTTMALPYAIKKPKKVLIIYAGAGFEVAHALYNRASNIHAIEPNATVTALLKGPYAMSTDSLFYQPEVHLNNTTPRSFIKQTVESYDLIQLPLSGAFGGTVGLNALQEENLFTAEALFEMWQKLSPDGLILLSSYLDVPPRISLKNAALIAGLCERLEIADPLQHVIAVRSWATLSYVIKKKPLEANDLIAVSRFCDENSFDPVLFSGSEAKETYNSLENQATIELIKEMFGPNRAQVMDDYDFNISIPTDNQPYFYQFLRLRNIVKQWQLLGERAAFLELGYLIVLVTFLQVFAFAFVLIIVPLFKLGFKKGHKSWVLFYFSGLGLGYMFLEIVLIKYFMRFLGHPIYAVATVISVMLVSSGLGSLCSSRLNFQEKKLSKLTALISALILIYALSLSFILSQTESWPLLGKLIVTVFTIGIPAFFMGMPFPMGLKLVNSIHQNQVPWAWGINGCVSVISTSLAAIIAVELGFVAVLLLAAAAYLMSFVSVLFARDNRRAINSSE